MPFPVAAAITGAAGIASSFLNAGSQRRTNRDSQAWNEKMFELQGQRDMANWHMTNEYNSPQAQMKRLQEAGLNPNLVYGNGSAVNTASSPHASAPAGWNPKAPEMDLGSPARSAIDTFFNVKMKDAQLDNLQAQNTVLMEEAALKRASTRSTLANAGLTEFNLGYKSDLRDVSADFARESLRSKQIGNTVALADNERRAALTSSTLKEAAERILSMRLARTKVPYEIAEIKSRIESLKANTDLAKLDADLWRDGVTRNDPLWQRMLSRLIGREGISSGMDALHNAVSGAGWTDVRKLPDNGFAEYLRKKRNNR